MMVRVYGFDWEAYTGLVMPAFAHWLVEGDETAIYQLYKQTRCAREEQFIPPAMQQTLTWTRAQAFVQQLPRGTHTRKEYQILCSAEQFSAVNDSYIHRHSPQLYQNSDALRAVWGAIIEEYCQSWFTLPKSGERTETAQPQATVEQAMNRGEIVALLHSAGLSELAREVSARAAEAPHLEEEPQEDFDMEDVYVSSRGIEIGRHPTTLHIRGWLAPRSIRAMALFELLVCGRRTMPFGFRAGEPYEAYIGYLNPDEVWQLAACLRSIDPPSPAEAEADYTRFRQGQIEPTKEFRMLDEVQPAHATAFLTAVRIATQCGLGLLCSMGG